MVKQPNDIDGRFSSGFGRNKRTSAPLSEILSWAESKGALFASLFVSYFSNLNS
jgi:hypothetical protein